MTEWQEVEALQSTCQGSAGFLLVSEGRSSAIAREGGKAFDVHRSLFPNCFEPTRRMPLGPQPLDPTRPYHWVGLSLCQPRLRMSCVGTWSVSLALGLCPRLPLSKARHSCSAGTGSTSQTSPSTALTLRQDVAN